MIVMFQVKVFFHDSYVLIGNFIKYSLTYFSVHLSFHFSYFRLFVIILVILAYFYSQSAHIRHLLDIL